jgi:hypothetical protein
VAADRHRFWLMTAHADRTALIPARLGSIPVMNDAVVSATAERSRDRVAQPTVRAACRQAPPG